MALNIIELLVGDTNYISKHNSNNTVLQNAVETLQVQIGQSSNSAINYPLYAQTVTGSGSGRTSVTEVLAADAGSGTLSISSGTVWVGAAAAMRGAGAVVLDFTGSASSTYFTHVDATGVWSFDTVATEAVHTIGWNGSAFTSIVQPQVIWTSSEYLDALYSTTYDTTYDALTDRLDTVEGNAVSEFTLLTDAPATYSGQTGKVPTVNGAEDGLEFLTPATGVTTFEALTDTPANYTGGSGKVATVNGTEDGIEFLTPTTGVTTFEALTDTPANYTGGSGKVATVNGTEDGIEFLTPTTGVTTFEALTDTPADFTGNGGKQLAVNSGGTALEFVDEPYDLGGTYPGAPAASVVMSRFPFTRQVVFPSGLTASQGVLGTAATAQTDFDIQKDGVSVGTMRFAAAATTATFIMASETTFAAGDVLTIVAPGTPDSTAADVGWGLAGTR